MTSPSSRRSEEMAVYDDFAEFIEELEGRRSFIYKHVPRCQKCGADQVQVIKILPPAVWRCRMCKHRFQYEPPAP